MIPTPQLIKDKIKDTFGIPGRTFTCHRKFHYMVRDWGVQLIGYYDHNNNYIDLFYNNTCLTEPKKNCNNLVSSDSYNESDWDLTDKDLAKKLTIWKQRCIIIDDLCQKGGI